MFAVVQSMKILYPLQKKYQTSGGKFPGGDAESMIKKAIRREDGKMEICGQPSPSTARIAIARV
ncbi:MAG: hypothetical protein LBD58_06245 [Treponema sp.]|jgi:hypothetical protein|nr:hypothetical protein [Treponema sp.]